MFRMFAILLALALTGCATIGEKAGFTPSTDLMSARVEPWQSNAIPGDIKTTLGVTVSVILMPQPLPESWQRELVDSTRSYEIGGRRVPLTRTVFRAMQYSPEGILETVYPAVVNESASALFVILPYGFERSAGSQVYIASAMGRWLMRVDGTQVELPKGATLTKIEPSFLVEHQSRLQNLVLMHRGDEGGQGFLRALDTRYPWLFEVGMRVYSGREEQEMRQIASFTKREDALDCFVSEGSVKLAPGMAPVSLGISVLANLWNMRRCDQ